MDINIIMLNGESHVLRVNHQDTVGSLKVQIQEKLGVQSKSQKLVSVNGMNTTLSDDSQLVSYYGVHHGARVSLLIIQPPIIQPATIQVFLKNVEGNTSTYDIKPDETVANFKSKVQRSKKEGGQGVPVSQQSLIHQGREMTEGRLSDYKVEAMSTIYLTMRLRGG